MLGNDLAAATRRAVAVLDELGLPYAVVGGVAMNVWQRPRATRDADVLVCGQNADIQRLREAMRHAGFAHHDRANHQSLEGEDVYRFWWLTGPAGVAPKLDVLVGRRPVHQIILRRKVVVPALDTQLSVASIEDVILLKLLAGRPIDRVDAVDLARIHRDRLDEAYLQSAAQQMRVADAWRDVLSEARAGE